MEPTPTTRLDRLREKLRPVTLVLYTFSLVLDVLNSTGVTFAIESISREYHISETESSWALSAYALTFGAFLLISGRLGTYKLLLSRVVLTACRRRCRTQKHLRIGTPFLCSLFGSYRWNCQ